jgi:transposase-like protein
MTYVIRSVVRFAGAETVGAAGPTELHLAEANHAKFVIGDESIEQDHRGIKQRYRPTGGLKTSATAERFCRVFEEVRAFLQPQSQRNQGLSLKQRREIHQERFTHLLEMMAAA